MKYKITGEKFYFANIYDMLRYCNGTMTMVKTRSNVNRKFNHEMNFKPVMRYDNTVDENKSLMHLLYGQGRSLVGLSENGITYIIVEANDICEDRWKSFGYKVSIAE